MTEPSQEWTEKARELFDAIDGLPQDAGFDQIVTTIASALSQAEAAGRASERAEYLAPTGEADQRASADFAAGHAAGMERAAKIAEAYQRDASFDDSQVGAMEHNSNQANIASAIRKEAGTK